MKQQLLAAEDSGYLVAVAVSCLANGVSESVKIVTIAAKCVTVVPPPSCAIAKRPPAVPPSSNPTGGFARAFGRPLAAATIVWQGRAHVKK